MNRNEMIDVLKGNVKYIDAKACQEDLDEIADWISNMGSTDGSKPYDLYRCPWCGGFAIVIKEPMKPGHMKIYVKCTNCGAVHPHGTFSTYDSFVCSNEEAEDLAVDAWNTRYKFD